MSEKTTRHPKILAARKLVDGDMYIPFKAMAPPIIVAQLQAMLNTGQAKLWTEQTEGKKLFLHPPCNAQIWTPGLGRYDIQIEEVVER